MKKRTIILLAGTLLIAAGALYAVSEYNRKVKDLSKVRADMRVSASSLINSFEDNESAANTKYLGKIIEVEGMIRSVEKNDKGYFTVILGEEGSMSSVRCSMDSVYNTEAAALAAGNNVVMKGACTGFQSDELLGSDVILNRCVVENRKTNEN